MTKTVSVEVIACWQKKDFKGGEVTHGKLKANKWTDSIWAKTLKPQIMNMLSSFFHLGQTLGTPNGTRLNTLHPMMSLSRSWLSRSMDRIVYCLACFDRISWGVSGLSCFILDQLRLRRMCAAGCPSFVLCRPQCQTALNLRSASWVVACVWFVPNHGSQPVLVKLLHWLAWIWHRRAARTQTNFTGEWKWNPATTRGLCY